MPQIDLRSCRGGKSSFKIEKLKSGIKAHWLRSAKNIQPPVRDHPRLASFRDRAGPPLSQIGFVPQKHTATSPGPSPDWLRFAIRSRTTTQPRLASFRKNITRQSGTVQRIGFVSRSEAGPPLSPNWLRSAKKHTATSLGPSPDWLRFAIRSRTATQPKLASFRKKIYSHQSGTIPGLASFRDPKPDRHSAQIGFVPQKHHPPVRDGPKDRLRFAIRSRTATQPKLASFRKKNIQPPVRDGPRIGFVS